MKRLKYERFTGSRRKIETWQHYIYS